MLRVLLIDRFKLAARLETREVPMYALALGQSARALGPKLESEKPECAPTGRSNPPPQCGRGASVGRGVIDFGSLDMKTLARILSSMPAVGRPVIDQTGLTARYRVDLRFNPAQAAAAPEAPPIDPDAPSIFSALQEQLGLKLESTKGPVPVLVITHIEAPSAN